MALVLGVLMTWGEDPVVGGLSEVSVVTIKAIIAGDDVKAKDIGAVRRTEIS